MKSPDTVSERRLAIDALDQAIVNLSARINAANYELLTLIRQFDERAGWLRWGLSNCTEWLHWRCDLSPCAAREKVRVAHALKDLPEISSAFAKGVLSYSKVRALTRVATRDNESSLVQFALTTTAARVEERCRQLRNAEPVSTDEANHVHRNRALRILRDRERGTMTITVELPLEQGALIEQALAKAMEQAPHNGPEFEAECFAARQADALVDVAREYVSGSSSSQASTAEAYQVVVHVDESALTRGEGRADLPVESVRRLSCDAGLITMIDGEGGEPLSVGRRQRTVSTAIKRALWARDQGCRFPGCGNARFVDAHHIRHWSQGGETSLENLLLLCTRHHRLVHEDGYEIRRDCRGQWYFRRPDGRAVPQHGYHPDDMTDDEVELGDLSMLARASAEASTRDGESRSAGP